MATSPRALVEKQVRKVRRRLTLQNFGQMLLVCWACALGVACLWFIGQSLVYSTCPEWLRWAVPGALLGAGALAALVITWLTAPALVTASLALDQRCELQERVTTLLTLPEDMLDRPAGQALAQDVHDQMIRLDAAGKFPVRVGWRTAALPVGAAGLMVLAAFFAPKWSGISFAKTAKTRPSIDTKEIEQQLDMLKKVAFTPKDSELKSDKLKELEAAWEKLVNKPLEPNNEDKVRERVGEMKALEEGLNRRAEELRNQRDKGKELQMLLKELGKLDGDKTPPGPAKDLEDALGKGDLQKARDLLEKLAKDMKDGKLDREQLKKLGDQFEQLHQKMKTALDRENLKKDLKDKLDKGEINKQQFDREMENLKDQQQDLKEWQELADLFGECKECMKNGNGEKAGEEIGKALEKVKMIELNDDELKEILDRLENLEDAEGRILGQLQGNGLDGGGPPGGERPIDPDDPKGKVVNQQQKAMVDARGQMRITGFAKGGNFTKVAPQEIGGAFKQAAQDGPEALDRQRIPRDAADLARGYFQGLNKQK